MIRLLLWLQWRQLRHTQIEPRYLVLAGFIGVLVLFGLAAAVAAAAALARSTSPAALEALASIGFPLLAIMLLLVGIPRVFNQLYSSRDLELLFALPVPARSVFLFKYAQSVAREGGFALVLALVPLLGYGVAAGAAWPYFPVVVLVVGSVVTGALAICHLLDLLLTRLVPARRVRGLMTALSALAGLLGAVGGQFLGRGSDRISVEGIESLPRLPAWLPTTWGATALARGVDGQATSALYAGGLALLAVALVGASTTLVERGLRLGWVRLSEEGKRRRARPGRRVAGALPGPRTAIALKELRLLRRDPREWMTFVPFVVALGFALYGTLTSGQADDRRVVWLLAQSELAGGFAFILANVAAPAVVRDGAAAWVVRSAPLGGWQIALGTFWAYWLAPLAGALLLDLGLGVALDWRASWLVLGCVSLAGLSAGAIGLGLLVGTYGAKHNADHPGDRLRLGASLLLTVVTGAFMLVAALPLGVALALETGAPIVALATLWTLALAAAVAALSLRATARRIDAGVQVALVERGR